MYGKLILDKDWLIKLVLPLQADKHFWRLTFVSSGECLSDTFVSLSTLLLDVPKAESFAHASFSIAVSYKGSMSKQKNWVTYLDILQSVLIYFISNIFIGILGLGNVIMNLFKYRDKNCYFLSVFFYSLLFCFCSFVIIYICLIPFFFS